MNILKSRTISIAISGMGGLRCTFLPCPVFWGEAQRGWIYNLLITELTFFNTGIPLTPRFPETPDGMWEVFRRKINKQVFPFNKRGAFCLMLSTPLSSFLFLIS